MQNLIIRNDLYNQIKYRENVVRGTVTAVNNNGTYSVRFKCEDTSYPFVPTYAKNSNLQIGDRVTVLFEGRNREMPKILAFADNYSEEDNRVKHSDWILTAPTVPLIAVIVEDYASGDYLKYYDLDGNIQNAYSYYFGDNIIYFETDCMAMDSDNNVYYIKSPNYLAKIDLEGNETSVAIAGYPESIAIGADGYIYTREQNGEIHKRNKTTFVSQSHITITAAKSYYGLVLDSAGNIYTVNYSDGEIEKWSSAGVKIANHAIANANSSSLGLVGNYIIRTSLLGAGHSYKIHKDLGNDETVFNLTNIGYQHGCGSLSNKYLFVGENNSNYKLYLEKYNTGDSLDWSIIAENSGYSPNNSMVAAYPF